MATRLKWFNTAAFSNPPEDRRGSATVGMIEGPSFQQMDVSFRKNFRFGGRYNLTPIFDIFNLFNTVNLGNPNVDANNVAFGTINHGPAAAPVPVRRPLRFLVADAGPPVPRVAATTPDVRCHHGIGVGRLSEQACGHWPRPDGRSATDSEPAGSESRPSSEHG